MDDKTVIRFPNDNTVIRPRPGGKRSPSNGAAYKAENTDKKIFSRSNLNPRVKKESSYSDRNHNEYQRNINNFDSSSDVSDTGSNQILSCASTLISLIIKLSNSSIHNEVSQLKIKLQEEIKQFEITAGHSQLSGDTILQARYILCTTLDEMVASTLWGQDSDWSQHSLLSIFHGETWGGEKFFLLLERLQKEPLKNLEILELMYICMSLGFQGKYRVIDNGYAEVEYLREDLYRQLRSLKNDFNKELSSHWHGISDQRGALIRYVPLWVVGALSGVVLLATFSSFTYMLDQSSSPVMGKILKLGPVIPDEDKQPVNDEEMSHSVGGTERLVRPPSKQAATNSSNRSTYMILKNTSKYKGGLA